MSEINRLSPEMNRAISEFEKARDEVIWTSEPASALSRGLLEARYAALADFIRSIAEFEHEGAPGTSIVHGLRAIELKAHTLYQKLTESHDL